MSNLEQGIQAIKTGDKQAAIRFLALAIQQDPKNASAWLWLSQCLDDPAKKKDCLQRVLKFSPGNQDAMRELASMEKATIDESQERSPDPTQAASLQAIQPSMPKPQAVDSGQASNAAPSQSIPFSNETRNKQTDGNSLAKDTRPAILTFHRYISSSVNSEIILDGRKVGEVSGHDELKVNVAPGSHRIIIRVKALGGIKSEVTITANPGDDIAIANIGKWTWQEPPAYPSDNPNLLADVTHRKIKAFTDSVYFDIVRYSIKKPKEVWFDLPNPSFPIPLRCEISEKGRLFSIYLDRSRNVMLYQCQVLSEGKKDFLGFDFSEYLQCCRANGEILGYVVSSSDKETKDLPVILLPDKTTKIAVMYYTRLKSANRPRRLIPGGSPDRLLVDLRTQKQIMAMEWASVKRCIFHRLLEDNLPIEQEELLTLAFVVRSVYWCLSAEFEYSRLL